MPRVRASTAIVAFVGVFGVFGVASLPGPVTAQGNPKRPRQFERGDWMGIRYLGKKSFSSEAAWRAALARAYFDAPLLESSLALLQAKFLKTAVSGFDYEIGARIVDSTNALLDKFIHEEGKELLRDEAARRLLAGDAREQRRAQLIFTRYKEVPPAVVKQIAASPLLHHRAWSAWCNSGRPRGEVASDPSLFKRGPTARTIQPNPIDDVAAQVRQHFLIPAEKLKGYKAEYRAGYHATFLPALASVPAHFPQERWTHLDFDGDGIDELFITGSIPDGWDGAELTMVLRWSRQHERWMLAYFRPWGMHERALGSDSGTPDLVIADFDGDGRPELAEKTSIIAGWCYEQIHYFDETTLAKPAHSLSRGVCVARIPNDPRPVIVARSAFNPTNGGKATYLVTALATALRVTRWTGPNAETVTVLVRGNGW